MKIARYSIAGQIRYGSVELASDNQPISVADLDGNPVLGPAAPTGETHAWADIQLLAPVEPSKVVGLAKNYSPDRDPDLPGPDAKPQVFLKPPYSVIAPGAPIVIPAISHDTGLEGELVVVIGKKARHITPEQVPDVIFGYTIVNDVTARDFFVDPVPWGLAKGFDDFTPMGPWITTDLTFEQACNTGIKTSVDGKLIQDGTTRRLLWGLPQQIAYLSKVMTLFPGDVIMSGTPAGACQIHAGETITIEVEGVGTLTNPVVAE